MKKLLLLSVFILPIYARAGLPDEDFVIDAIRESFKEGHAPSRYRLLPGKQWVCGMYDTFKGQQSGHVGVVLGGVKYKTTSMGIFSATAYYKTEVPYEIFSDSLMSYSSKNNEPFYFHFVREFADGLIVERSLISKNVTLPSIIDPRLQVTQYSYCLPYEKVDGRKKTFNHPWEKILKY